LFQGGATVTLHELLKGFHVTNGSSPAMVVVGDGCYPSGVLAELEPIIQCRAAYAKGLVSLRLAHSTIHRR